MTPLAPFPDSEAVLMDLVEDLGNTGEVTDDQLLDNLPFIRVGRIGGVDDLITDRPRLVVDTFAATRAQAYTLAETIRQRLTSGPSRVGSAVIDKAITLSGPQEVPWSPAVRRYSASYQLSFRRPASA